jgi:uncharacterized protein YkwD
VVDPSWRFDDVEEPQDLPPRRRKALGLLIVAGVVVLGLTVVAALAAFASHGSSPTVSAAGASASPVPPAVIGLPSDVDSPAPTESAPAPRTSTTTKPPPQSNGQSMAESAVVALVNEARARAGCRALTVDMRLANAARGHSADMAAHNYFAHTTPQGVTVGTRVTDAGYRWSLVGENIAAGQRDAAAVMRAWLNSPGHRANILNCRFRNIGVGLSFGARHAPIWTQDFGTPL